MIGEEEIEKKLRGYIISGRPEKGLEILEQNPDLLEKIKESDREFGKIVKKYIEIKKDGNEKEARKYLKNYFLENLEKRIAEKNKRDIFKRRI